MMMMMSPYGPKALSTTKRVVTWPTFLSYWKQIFSCIEIRKKGADTCTDCQLLCNEFCMQQAMSDRRRMLALQQQQQQDDEEGTDAESEEEEDGHDNAENLEIVIESMAETIEKAHEHVRLYQIQRDHGRQLIRLVRLDITRLLPSILNKVPTDRTPDAASS